MEIRLGGEDSPARTSSNWNAERDMNADEQECGHLGGERWCRGERRGSGPGGSLPENADE